MHHFEHVKEFEGANLRLHTKGNLSSLTELMRAEQPDLIWIRLPGMVNAQGCKQDRARALNVMRLSLLQIDLGGHLVIDGDQHNKSWNNMDIQFLHRLQSSMHRWCNYGMKHPDSDQPLSTTTRILSTFTLDTHLHCQCGVAYDQHTAAGRDSGTQWARDAESVRQYVSASTELARELRSFRLHKEAAVQSTTLSPPDSTSFSHSSKQPSLRKVHFDATDKEDNVNSAVVVGVSGNSNCFGEGGTAQSSITSEISTRLQEYLDEAFPTVAAIRAKEKRKADKAAGKEVQKKLQTVEQHHDDCGDDLTAIDEPGEETPADDFFTADAEGDERLNFHSGGSSHSHRGNEQYKIWKFLRSRHWLFGSEVDTPLTGTATVCDNFDAFISQAHEQSFSGQVDVIELFGGSAGTTKVLLRRYNAHTGENFDLISGYNLLSKTCREKFWNYMKQHKPVMVIMAPPCTGLAGWKSMNRIHHYDAWHRSRTTGIPLAKLAAEVAA